MTGIFQANLHFLRQAADLVDALEDGSYVRAEPMFYNSTVGGHLRHCLDHYESFTAGVKEGRIDYDARCRDEMVENKTHAARERINVIATSLGKLAETEVNPVVLVKMDCDISRDGVRSNKPDNDQWHTSSVGRELQFLVSHTVHHFAMIRGICQRAGNELDSDFGMALSTLRHREELAKNAAQDTTQSAI